VAAGCVPLIISDGTHLPFPTQIRWDAFTVTVPEADLFARGRAVFDEVLGDEALYAKKRRALAAYQEDVVYGLQSPVWPSRFFRARVAERVLIEAIELVPADGRYRRYPEGLFENCDGHGTG